MCHLLKKIAPAGVILVVVFLLVTTPASADMGPKPSMDFIFEYYTSGQLHIIEGLLLECESVECNKPMEMEYSTSPFFSCTTADCSSFSYGYGEYFILIITFSDGVSRQSNVFEKEHYSAEYSVAVHETHLVVEETGGTKTNPTGAIWITWLYIIPIGLILFAIVIIGIIALLINSNQGESLTKTSRGWITSLWIAGILIVLGSLVPSTFFPALLSLPITIFIEGGLLLIIQTIRNQPRLISLTLDFAGNLITLIMFNFFLLMYSTDSTIWYVILLFELFIVFIEAVILYLPQRRQVTFWQMLALSFVLNLASFTVGLFLPI